MSSLLCQAEKLNDERNWRKGLRVRLLPRSSVCLNYAFDSSISSCFLVLNVDFKCEILQPKSVLKSRKSEFDGLLDEEELPVPESNGDSSQMHNAESVTETNVRKLFFSDQS